MGVNASRVEAWTLYAIGSSVIFARVACRWKIVGLSGFQPDDYIIFLSWATYTTMTYAADIVGESGDLHALPLDERKVLSEHPLGEETQLYIYRTRWLCVAVTTYILFIWTLKINMLFLYQRIVRGLWVEKFIKPAMALVVITFIVIMTILFMACRPYHRMWVIYPDQGPLCQPQSVLNMVVPLSFNLLTDLAIAGIPAPVILRARNVSVWNRIFLSLIFGAVSFIMAAAVLRVVFVLLYKSGPVAAIWSCREDIVAIIVGQASLIRPMFRKSFWTRKQDGSNKYPSEYSKDTDQPEKYFGTSSKRRILPKQRDPFSITAALATVTDNTQIHGEYPESGKRDISML